MSRGMQWWPQDYATPNVKSSQPQPEDYQWVLQARETTLQYPDLTKFVAGKWPVVVNPGNSTTVPTLVTTHDNWKVTTGFVAGTLEVIAPTTGETPHGTWGDITMTPPVLGTLSGSDVQSVGAVCQLDTNLYVYLGRDNSNNPVCFAFDAGGKVGAAATFSGGASGNMTTVAGARLFKISTNSFIGFRQSAGTNKAFVATVNTSTLAITINSSGYTDTPIDAIQLSATVYLAQAAAANGLTGIVTAVDGTSITVGTAAASGSVGDAGGLTTLRIGNCATNKALAVYNSTGGGTSTTRALSGRTVDVNSGTAALTLNTATAGADNVLFDSLRTFVTNEVGATYTVCGRNGPAATSGSFFGVTVAGDTVTVTAVSTRASDLPSAETPTGTWVYRITGADAIRWDNTRTLWGHLATGVYCSEVTGGAISFGATLAFAAAKKFLKDFNASASTAYAVGGSLVDKLSVSGTTVSSTWQVAAAPTVVINDYLMDKAVQYNGTWYTWTLPTVLAVATPATWLFGTGNNITVNGPVY